MSRVYSSVRFCAPLIAVIAALSCGKGAGPLTFEARVSDLRRPGNHLARDKNPDDLIQVRLPGQLIAPPVAVDPVSRDQADWSTPERATASILSANRAGDTSWAVLNFVPAEREGIARQLADRGFAQSTFATYRNMGKVHITARAEQSGFTVVFLRGLDEDGDSSLMTVVLAPTPLGWRQTNALVNDDTFDVVWTAFQTGGMH